MGSILIFCVNALRACIDRYPLASARSLDDRRLSLHDVVDVVAHGNEQVEEQLRVALLHLHLHRAAAFEGLAAADDECKVVGTEP